MTREVFLSSSTPLPYPQLPPPIEEVLKSFLQSAKDSLGSNLLAAVLFGSAAEGKLRATSDLNLILVLSAFEQARVDPLRQPLRVAQAAIQLQPMFLLKEELPHAARSFAPKFADILRRRVILFGEDPFASLSIPRDAQVRQLRQQLLNLVLRLRASYAARSLREEQLTLVIAGAVGPLRAYAATLLELEGRPAASSSTALEAIGADLGISEWPRLLAQLAAAQDFRLSALGEAARLYFLLLDLARRMQARAETLPAEVGRESL